MHLLVALLPVVGLADKYPSLFDELHLVVAAQVVPSQHNPVVATARINSVVAVRAMGSRQDNVCGRVRW